MDRVVILPDGLHSLVDGISSELGKCDLLVVCGGLGPTDDDLTREAIAEASSTELEFSHAAWEEVEAFFRSRDKTASPSNRKQALVPVGGKFISNHRGTAPGIQIEVKGTRVLAVPGVPSEFRVMLQHTILKELRALEPGPLFKLWGIGESLLVDFIREKKTIPPDLEWGTIARPEGITLHFKPSFWDRSDASTLVDRLRRDLEPYLVAEKEITPVDRLADLCLERGLKIGTAESCTGGLLAEKFTEKPGSSNYFLGSIVSYSNSVKMNVLNVEPKILENYGAVSKETALAMAKGAIECLDVDLSMAITGIAGPGGGSEEKPVGTVHMAVAHRDGWCIHREGRFGGDRGDIRERSAHGVVALAIEGILESG